MTARVDEPESNNFTVLRLILALMVVFGHFKLLSGTQVPPFPFNLSDAAVDAFFVVSGFLIAGSFDRSRTVRSFYTRRVFRLLPMYVFVVVVQTGVLMALQPAGPFSAPEATVRYLIANLSFANFLQYDIGGVLHGLHVPGINPSLWTLKIELGFYFVVPAICWAFRRWGWPVLAVIFVASAAYAEAMLQLGLARWAKQLPGQLQFFAVGMALYYFGQKIRVSVPVAAVVSAGFLAVWTRFDPMPPAICPLVVGAFVFCFALRLPLAPMRSDMSYSVYLLHGPLIQTLILLGLFQDQAWMLGVIVITVLSVSFVTEHLIERPGIELGKQLSRRMARPPPVGAAAGIATVPR